MRPAIPLIAILILCSTIPLQGDGPRRNEQTHFSAEDPAVKHPAVLPRSVLDILRQDKIVLDALENENIPTEQLPRSWFSASTVHLAPGESGFVVIGEPPLAGANTAPFWAFCATDHGYKLVLFVGAHDLVVLPTRSNRHRDIEASAVTMMKLSTVVFHFNGERYTSYKTKSEEIR